MLAEGVELNGQLICNGERFPDVVTWNGPAATLDEQLAAIRPRREALVARADHFGATLFRGFAVTNPQDFDRFIETFELPNFPYEDSLSNAVRVNLTPRVFTANEAPASVTIFLHHEMAQTPIYPSRLFFFCEKAAESGGATPLCRSDLVWDQLAKEYPQFAADCQSKGLKYSHVMPAANDAGSGMGRSWQSTLKAETREQAEGRLKQLGYSWEWSDTGDLSVTTPVLDAVRTMPDGRKVFFNQLIAAFNGWKDTRNDPTKSIRFGDGSPLDREAVTRSTVIADQLSFEMPWQAGDVVLVNNFLAMHGRRTFTGTRRVLASLVA